jgi:hypothetical protein
MSFRRLRIAWSVFWGLACALLIVLWVRSYWWIDYLQQVSNTFIWQTCPYDGKLCFNWSNDAQVVEAGNVRPGKGWYLWARSVESWRGKIAPPLSKRLFQPFSLRPGRPNELVIPFWAPVALSGIFSTLPWVHKLRWRYTLRTLLFGTTLVAVGLGLIVYFSS